MRLEDMTIAARPRTVAEVHDLAIAVIRRHAVPVAVVAVVGMAPCMALACAATWFIDEPGLACWLHLVLAFTIAPLATAPLTAYLGAAMFGPAPRVRAAWAPAGRTVPVLVIGALWRLICAAVVVGVPWTRGHLAEVAVLERLGVRRSWVRAGALDRADDGVRFLHLGLGAGVVAGAAWCLVGTLGGAEALFRRGVLWADSPVEVWLPGHAVVPTVALWIAMAYLAVVRFCAYIDLRTRAEGWDLALDLRQAGTRIGAPP
jgi:hypothetical protein